MRYNTDSALELADVALAWGVPFEEFDRLDPNTQAFYVAHHRARQRLAVVQAEQERRRRIAQEQAPHGTGRRPTRSRRR